MNEREQEFLKKLLATFRVEAEEHLQAMYSGLLVLEKNLPANEQAAHIEAIFRHAHSLKGAARAVTLSEIESICQRVEDVFATWTHGEIDLSPEGFDTLHRALDLMGKLIGADAQRPQEEAATVSAMVEQLASLAVGQPVGRARAGIAPVQPPFAAEPTPLHADDLPRPAGPVAAETKAEASSFKAPADSLDRPVFLDTIRISTSKLDRLLLKAEEMLAVKKTIAQHAADLRQFDSLFAQWTKRWAEIQPQIRQLRNSTITSADLDGQLPVHDYKSAEPARPLDAARSGLLEFLDWNFACIKSMEGKLRAQGKAAAQAQYFTGKLVDDLLGDSKKLILLPFSVLSDLFPKLVRDLSREQGKEINLVVQGGDVEIDKRILEEMKDPLIHLVRNCIDHGVEKPDKRQALNKPPRATITIAVATVDANKVEIVVGDDGAGIDLARVKEAAVKRGMLSAEEATVLAEEKALELIFQSELSTSPIITEISGRGLGLPIVREKTEKLGGRVRVETTRHAGATFRMVLPLTLVTFRGILVRAANQVFVIPTVHVERVDRIRSAGIQTVENRETVSLNGCAISFVWLEDVLEMVRHDPKSRPKDFISMVVLGAGDQRIAFGVDEVLHDEEVLVKPLPKPLSRVRNVAAATTLASGKVVPILNAADLMKSAPKTSSRSRPEPAPAIEAAEKPPAKNILLVEDSITSRMLLKGILESGGYQVKTAVDGVEAWTFLRSEDFDLVVSDVEMPRMNGFDLTSHLRADKRFADKPVVLVTALASKEDRERGIDVGANAYIVKSGFDQSNLLEVIRRLA